MSAIAAWFSGVWRVFRVAWIAVVAYVLLLGLTLPLGWLVQRELPAPSHEVTVEPGSGPVPNLDFLEEVTVNRGGLAGTLGPTVVGVAAPLDNLDRFLDGRLPPVFVLALSVVSALAWAWLWGGTLARFGNARDTFIGAGNRFFVPLAQLSAASIGAAVVLFVTVRPLLFSMVWPALSAGASESTAFAWRAAIAMLFVAILATVTTVIDYARVALVLGDAPSPRAAVLSSVRLIRSNAIAVAFILVLSALALAGLLTVYGGFEFIPGGSVPTLARVIVLGQAYILARIVLRLLNAAAQVALYQSVKRREATP